MNDVLFQQVKRKLNITWEDADTNDRVTDIIESAIPDFKHLLGIVDDDFDFSKSGKENTLFKNYCLYEWNHCSNEFKPNYADDIAELQQKWAVKYHKESGGDSDAEE
jgi:hypothetical protein